MATVETDEILNRRLTEFTAKVRGYAILTLDADGLVHSWNEGARLVKGYDADEIIGAPYERFFPEDDVRAGRPADVLRLARERGSHEEEGWRMRKDGTRFWAHVYISRIDDEDGRLIGYGKITEDLTERRLHEQALQARVEELERFAYVTSHDLSEPLRSISGYADVLHRRYASDLDESGQHYLNRIMRSSERMRSLIDDLLAFSRAGRRGLGADEIDLRDLVDEALAGLPTDRASVTIGDLPRVRGDRSLLLELLGSVIGNALKFADGPAQVDIAGTRRGRCVEITVADRGIGIPAEYGERVFDLFQRLHTRDRFEGNGLGLAISRRIAERHSGELTSAPRDGGGTVFTLTLPS